MDEGRNVFDLQSGVNDLGIVKLTDVPFGISERPSVRK